MLVVPFLSFVLAVVTAAESAVDPESSCFRFFVMVVVENCRLTVRDPA